MLSVRFKELRKALNIGTQIELQEILNFPNSRVQDIERGKVKELKSKEIEQLQEKLLVNSWWILTGKGKMLLKKELDEHQRLKYIVDNANLSIAGFAQKIAASPDTIEAIIKGQQKLSPQIARLIDDNYAYNPNWVLYGKGHEYAKTSEDLTGDYDKLNMKTTKELNLYEDEIIEAYRKLSYKKREYYYFKIKSDALEIEINNEGLTK